MSSLTHNITNANEASNAAMLDDTVPAAMKRFDLEKALTGAPVCTRDGTLATIVRMDDSAPIGFRLKVKVPQYDYLRTFSEKDGRFYSDGRTDDLDLFMMAQETAPAAQPMELAA